MELRAWWPPCFGQSRPIGACRAGDVCDPSGSPVQKHLHACSKASVASMHPAIRALWNPTGAVTLRESGNARRWCDPIAGCLSAFSPLGVWAHALRRRAKLVQSCPARANRRAICLVMLARNDRTFWSSPVAPCRIPPAQSKQQLTLRCKMQSFVSRLPLLLHSAAFAFKALHTLVAISANYRATSACVYWRSAWSPSRGPVP